MSILLQVHNLSKQYGGQKIFSGLNLTVSSRQKIGVIGKNGAGKSTLFRIITGLETADQGQIIIGSEARLGYLKQEEDFIENESALNYLERTSGQPDWKVKKLAAKFQLDARKLSEPAINLSGGWRMRLKLTGMLLLEPNLFLLDEPTNYLDLNTLLLLENYLNSYKGSFLIISHDREFIKKTCAETLEVSATGCYHYPGKIESYLAFKAQKLTTLLKANESLDRQQQHLQDFVDRFRAKASKAKQAQALIRKINKLEQKRIGIEHQASITRINIPLTVKRQNFALRTHDLTVGYENPVVSQINIDCRAGERLVLLGMNGQGKTTLLRSLAGNLPALDGHYRWFTGSRLVYHGQEVINQLNPLEQVGDYLQRQAAPDIKTETVLKMAGDFMFRAEELKKPVGVLSGGEKARLVLAGQLLSRPDVLLLDEPTCHLDFETVEALGAALKKFNGTVLFASHDRTFSSLVSTGLIEIYAGQAKRRLEDYDDYVNKLEKQLAHKVNIETLISDNQIPKQNEYLALKNQRRQTQILEREIIKLQTEQQKLIEYFLKNPLRPDPAKTKELEILRQTIADKEDEWLELNT